HRNTPTPPPHPPGAAPPPGPPAGAGGAAPDPDLFFRADGERQITWQARRAEATRLCTGCPVRAACEELALRDGDGRSDADEMVRAGLTGPELAAVRSAHTVRLAAAVDADRDTEGRRLDTLMTRLHREAGTSPDSSRNGGPRSVALRATAQNDRLRALAVRIRQIRTARRARAGWGVAA
ncbi:WhiB family transcriptional regulator, partial [Streptomyces clavifer]|uniref:WhiB family transcriptional regulator n=1 Tax=Streptomyces clavifer TaxID=68188 RepID=UPI003317BD18